MNKTALLQVEDLRVSYGKITALHGVNLHIDAGKIVTVIGPNGAGKTTLLNGIMGLLPATGMVAYAGHALMRQSVPDRVRQGVSLVTERRDLFGTMSVNDNLLLGAFHRRNQREYQLGRELDEVFELFPRLKERRAQQAHTLSGGERQMLALGRALMAKPRLLMLDEPSLGLAPMIVAEVFAIIRRLCDEGVSILLVEQNALAALRLADYAYVLETGCVALEGNASDLANDPRIAASYLGQRDKNAEPSLESSLYVQR